MPAYRFTWRNFDDDTVVHLARELGFDGSGRSAAESYLSDRVKRPGPDFVRRTKSILEDVWLPKHEATTRAVVERLQEWSIGPGGRPRTHASLVDYIRRCRNTTSIQSFLAEALIRFGDADREDEDGELGPLDVRRFAIVEPAKQPPDARRPHAYQVEAWDKLSAHLAESERSGVFQGLLVMPTGAGKTYTAAHWLLSKVINQGGKLLWIAHRAELLNQAASAFYRLAGLATTRDRLRVRIVSSEHCSVSQIDPADDILICSVQSLRQRPDVFGPIIGDRKRFVVVDEAHHAVATSYREVLQEMLAGERRRILGLTATPTRTAEKERPLLTKLFGGRVLHEVPVRNLIERGILARPIPVRVETNADVERGLTPKNIDHLRQFHDLDEEWLARIAGLHGRNEVIVDHYVANQAKYGKTLVFAINVEHAALLAEAFRARGVAADYVASYRIDASAETTVTDTLRRFREPGGGIDVLVNVQMLTEGVDLPAVQTVFLTRPTASEILLRQMIGRGLRGPAAGGTTTCFIVSFEDHWERFRDWESQLALVPDILIEQPDPQKTPTLAQPPTPAPPAVVDAIPWDLVRSFLQSLRSEGGTSPARVFEAVPHGSLVLEREVEGDVVRRVIAVYEHQEPCWQALLQALDRDAAAWATQPVEAVFAEYFSDTVPPAPSVEDVRAVLDHYAARGGRPTYESFEERAKTDPRGIAARIDREDMGEKARTKLVEEAYGPLARAVYPTMREFRQAVDDALWDLQHPGETQHIPRGVPIFEPGPEQQLAPGDHDLERLMKETLDLGAQLLGGGPLAFTGTVEWSRRIIKGWWGYANWANTAPSGSGRIRVNVLLNSTDVSEQALRFLLWHEYLHLYLKAGHTPEFRAIERKWPGMHEPWRELYNLNERFGIQYW